MPYLIRNILIKKSRGFSLVETLLFSGIVSVILLGTLKLMGISAQSVKVNKVSSVEKEVENLIRRGIMEEASCIYNLDFNKIQNGDPLQARGEITELKELLGGSDTRLFSEGQILKDSIEIVKMELTGTVDIVHPSGPAVERFFTVYYKKVGTGALNTLGGGSNCSSSNVSDCYFKHYKLMYEIDTIGFSPTTTQCAVSVCTQGACCYTIDRLDETYPIEDISANAKGRSTIGCRGTSNISKSRTVALGFTAGIGEDGTGVAGHSNVFMGYSAGKYSTAATVYDPMNPEGSRNVMVGAFYGRPVFPSPPPNTGYSNIFLGSFGAWNNTLGSKNVFLGNNVGKRNTEGSSNIFIGYHAGSRYISGEGNIFIGYNAGELVGDVSAGNPADSVSGNVFIGQDAGQGIEVILPGDLLLTPTTHSNTGQYNTFLGYEAGARNTSGNSNIYIGRKIVGEDVHNPTILKPDEDYQLSIGNLILGRMPDPGSTPLSASPNIPATPGVVINGNLKVKGHIFLCGGGPACPNYPDYYYPYTPSNPPPSSKVYKKNIQSFKNYEKALEDIINTPLFTYAYKKDRPEKSRMGIISEELPKHLQLKEKVDPRLRGDDSVHGKTVIPAKKPSFPRKREPRKKVSMPDWASIYGTFWAGIRALFVQFKSFKEKMLVKLKGIKNIRAHILKVTKGNKNHLIGLEAQVEKTGQISKNTQEENKQQKKQFIQVKTKLDTTKVDLQTIKQELQKIRYSINTGTAK